jgi:hypothetical protein
MKQKSKWKTWHKVTIGILGGFLILIIIAVNSESTEPAVQVKTMTKEDSVAVRKKQIEGLFSAWNGSLPKLVEATKEQLNDPASFEHEKTLFWDRDSLLVVKMEYTAKNGFGGRVRGLIMAHVDLQGNIIKIVESY